MLKLALFGCLALTAVSSVHATSCIITGDTDRPCSASGSATSEADMRTGSVLDGLRAATEAEPFEGRGWSFGLSNLLSALDCLSRSYSAIFIR
ncbi:MAG: hypothetical protein ACI4RD_11195 [Kiritimatiellia bacterium]